MGNYLNDHKRRNWEMMNLEIEQQRTDSTPPVAAYRLTASALAIVLATWTVPATAQSEPAAAVSAASTSDDSTVGEIVVTAQRREEKLSRVPVAVAAFNADTLQSR